MSTSLTTKQEYFCQLIALHHYSQFDAYKEAYNVGDATLRSSIDEMAYSLMAKNVQITSRIEELKQSVIDSVIKKSALTKEYVLEQLHQNALKASQAIPVTDRSGNAIGEFTYYPNAVNRSYELIGKELDMFRDRAEIATQSISLELKAASLDELEAMLALVRQQRGALNEAGNGIPLVETIESAADNVEGQHGALLASADDAVGE
jgi:hypothetical protein